MNNSSNYWKKHITQKSQTRKTKAAFLRYLFIYQYIYTHICLLLRQNQNFISKFLHYQEILEDVHESINDAEGKNICSEDVFTGSNTDYFKSDSLSATKELLQTKILGTDESRARVSAMSPKLNRISNRVPSSYPWKDSGKSGKDGMGNDTKNEKLESPCLWMARTSSIKRFKTSFII